MRLYTRDVIDRKTITDTYRHNVWKDILEDNLNRQGFDVHFVVVLEEGLEDKNGNRWYYVRKAKMERPKAFNERSRYSDFIGSFFPMWDCASSKRFRTLSEAQEAFDEIRGIDYRLGYKNAI